MLAVVVQQQDRRQQIRRVGFDRPDQHIECLLEGRAGRNHFKHAALTGDQRGFPGALVPADRGLRLHGSLKGVPNATTLLPAAQPICRNDFSSATFSTRTHGVYPSCTMPCNSMRFWERSSIARYSVMSAVMTWPGT